MNIGFWSCIVLIPIFLLIALFFALMKEKGAFYVSGFKSLTEAEQNLYDKAYISRDMRNNCLIWAAVMVVGTICCYFISKYAAVVAYLIWIFLFLQNVHMDAYTAFEKYLKK